MSSSLSIYFRTQCQEVVSALCESSDTAWICKSLQQQVPKFHYLPHKAIFCCSHQASPSSSMMCLANNSPAFTLAITVIAFFFFFFKVSIISLVVLLLLKEKSLRHFGVCSQGDHSILFTILVAFLCHLTHFPLAPVSNPFSCVFLHQMCSLSEERNVTAATV